MQDPDIPPQAEEDINGAVEGVRRNVAPAAQWAALVRNSRGFTPPPWTTATAPIWAVKTATAVADRDGLVFPHRIQLPTQSRFRFPKKTPRPASLRSSKTCSF